MISSACLIIEYIRRKIKVTLYTCLDRVCVPKVHLNVCSKSATRAHLEGSFLM